jgi:hypothetical protein
LCPQLATSDFRFYTSDFRDQTSGSWDQTSGNAEAAALDTGISKLAIFYVLSTCISEVLWCYVYYGAVRYDARTRLHGAALCYGTCTRGGAVRE